MSSEQAWRTTWSPSARRLRAFAWSLSHNGADADDLVQDTLIKAWSTATSSSRAPTCGPGCFTILRNTYYTAASRRRREQSDPDGKHAASLSRRPTQEWTPDHADPAGGAAEAARRAPRGADPRRRGGRSSYEEAADICNCAVGTIKSQVNRARARLVRLMDARTRRTRWASRRRSEGLSSVAGRFGADVAPLARGVFSAMARWAAAGRASVQSRYRT